MLAGGARDDPHRGRGRDPRRARGAGAAAFGPRVQAGLTLANSPGLIDAGYRGEVIVAVVNLDRTEAVKIARGDRIAQLVVVAFPSVDPTWVDGAAGLAARRRAGSARPGRRERDHGRLFSPG